jgi:hypothetical protein
VDDDEDESSPDLEEDEDESDEAEADDTLSFEPRSFGEDEDPDGSLPRLSVR